MVLSNLTQGPIPNRKMTDLFFTLIFCSYVVLMCGVAALSFKDFKTNLLSKPLDSEGNVCGVDPGFEDFPYLFMLKFTEPYKSVCVKNCPVFDYAQMRYNSTGTYSKPITPVYFTNFTKAVESGTVFLNSWDKSGELRSDSRG